MFKHLIIIIEEGAFSEYCEILLTPLHFSCSVLTSASAGPYFVQTRRQRNIAILHTQVFHLSGRVVSRAKLLAKKLS